MGNKKTSRSFRKSKKAVAPRTQYPFATTPPGESFIEYDLKRWPVLRVSAGRYNKKHGTNFRVTTEKDAKSGNITLIRCGQPEVA